MKKLMRSGKNQILVEFVQELPIILILTQQLFVLFGVFLHFVMEQEYLLTSFYGWLHLFRQTIKLEL